MSQKTLTPRDEVLIDEALDMRWEDIDENLADTEEGRQALHDIRVHKYHIDEARNGMI